MNQSLHEAVKVIKTAILKAQSEVLRNANTSLLSLYYGIGRYVSQNSREGTWGTGAIDAISNQLQREMPGLRGFGSRNLKNMRSFYEFWSPVLNRQTPSADLEENVIVPLESIRQTPSAEFDVDTFLSVGFSNHVGLRRRPSRSACIISRLRIYGTEGVMRQQVRPEVSLW